MAEKIKFGIIGTGQRAYGAYGRLLTGAFAQEAELVALADTNEKRLKAVARRLDVNGIALYRDYNRMLAETELDAVVVETPDFTHEQVATDVLQAGKHVICEKPLATTVAGCQKILAAQGPEQVLQVGFVLRYNRVYSTAKKLIDDGVIGRVQQIVATDNRRGADYFRRWASLPGKKRWIVQQEHPYLGYRQLIAGGSPPRW